MDSKGARYLPYVLTCPASCLRTGLDVSYLLCSTSAPVIGIARSHDVTRFWQLDPPCPKWPAVPAISRSTPQPMPPSILSLPPYATTSPSRLQALYSDISPQKHSNPTSYSSNVEWWRKALEVIVSSGFQIDNSSKLVLQAGTRLMERVRVQGVGKPLALGAVVVRYDDLSVTRE